MKMPIARQKNGGLLIQVAAWAGLTVQNFDIIPNNMDECVSGALCTGEDNNSSLSMKVTKAKITCIV